MLLYFYSISAFPSIIITMSQFVMHARSSMLESEALAVSMWPNGVRLIVSELGYEVRSL